MIRYELHIAGIKKEGKLDDLQKEAYAQQKPFEVYKIIPSSMELVKVGKYRTMRLKDYNMLFEMLDRGHSKTAVEKRFHLGHGSLDNIIKNKEYQLAKA